jgi:3-oxoacyl-[acyl-carrier protein] reductase
MTAERGGMCRFDGKVTIVTGAGSGFGEAIARRFAAEGARLIVAEINEENGRRVAAAIESAGGASRFVRTDVSRAADVEAMIDAAVTAFGGLDVLVNNAGFAHRVMGLWDLSEEEYERMFATNVKGVFLGCKCAIPVMRRRGGGAIVNTASIGAVSPRPGATMYNASKGAVVTLTRGLAREVALFKIRVNAVNPVAVDTAFIRSALGVDSLPGEVRAQLLSTIPLGRLTEPSDVASAALFLASDEAAFLTGVCLAVDGGRSIS